jgi:hypothetical protein
MQQYFSDIEYKIFDKIIFFLISVYFILKPFYFWQSGLPQISDFIIIILILTYLLKSGFAIQYFDEFKKFILVGLFFILYVLATNLIWMVLLDYSLGFLLTSVYYIYNYFIVLLFISLYTEYETKLLEIVYKSSLISIFIQIFMYFAFGGFSGGRMTAGFNNPNQLGYYALLVLSILLFSSQKIEVNIKWFIFGVLSSTVLSLASLSKAAIISHISLIFFYIFAKTKHTKFKRNIIIIFVVLAIILTYTYFYTDLITSNQLYTAVNRRISSIGQDSDDSLEGRGYTRIFNHPEYWIFGAGEGNYYRLSTLFHSFSGEFHSTLGNIQVSYGIIGLLLFLTFMGIALYKDAFQSWYIIAFIMAYGLTHNGIRNSFFWILLALIAVNRYIYVEMNQIDNINNT